METLLSGYGHLLLFQRTGVQFPAPTLSGSLSSVSPVPEDLTQYSCLPRHTHACVKHTQRHVHVLIITKYKNKIKSNKLWGFVSCT